MKIVSKRRREVQQKQDTARHLEEKYMIRQLPLSEEEQAQVEQVFDFIRQELEQIQSRN